MPSSLRSCGRSLGVDLPDRGELHVAVAPLLGLSQRVDARGVERPLELSAAASAIEQLILELHQLLHLRQEPRIDLRQLVDLLDRPAHLHRVADVVQPALAGHGELAAELVLGDRPFLVERSRPAWSCRASSIGLGVLVERADSATRLAVLRPARRSATCRTCPAQSRTA